MSRSQGPFHGTLEALRRASATRRPAIARAQPGCNKSIALWMRVKARASAVLTRKDLRGNDLPYRSGAGMRGV